MHSQRFQKRRSAALFAWMIFSDDSAMTYNWACVNWPFSLTIFTFITMCHSSVRKQRIQDIKCTRDRDSCLSHQHGAAGRWDRKKGEIQSAICVVPASRAVTHTDTLHSTLPSPAYLCSGQVQNSIHCCLCLDTSFNCMLYIGRVLKCSSFYKSTPLAFFVLFSLASYIS